MVCNNFQQKKREKFLSAVLKMKKSSFFCVYICISLCVYKKQQFLCAPFLFTSYSQMLSSHMYPTFLTSYRCDCPTVDDLIRLQSLHQRNNLLFVNEHSKKKKKKNKTVNSKKIKILKRERKNGTFFIRYQTVRRFRLTSLYLLTTIDAVV